MQFQAFKFSFLAVAFAIPSNYGALASKKTADPAFSSISSRCPRSEYLTDIISCIAAEAKSEAGDNPGHANRLENLEKEVATLKAQLANAGKPSPTDGPLPQNLLLGGYDKYTAYDLAWQSLHMAAAAACRGSTASGGSGPWANSVRVRNFSGNKSCAQICRETGHFRNCDAEVSIHGKKGKATNNGQEVGKFYNYGCGASWGYGGNEASVSDEAILNHGRNYFSFCCCRKP